MLRHISVSTLLFLLLSLCLHAQVVGEKQDSLVRLLGCNELQQVESGGVSFRKALGDARFEHNSTLLVCDTALWNVSTNIINAFGNVRIIQEETILESDRLDYIVDSSLAQFRGITVQLQDKDGNTLRTRNLDYNTKDSVATFFDGGALRDKDGQIIESILGTYDSKLKTFTFVKDVNMYTDSVFVKTEDLKFNTLTSIAHFGRGTNVWKDGNMLSAQSGRYDRTKETFLFRQNVHLLTENQEAWSDSLMYYKLRNDVEMFGNVELLDTTRNVSAVAGYMRYTDSTSVILMTRDPAVIAVSEQDGQRDTSYIGADTLVYKAVFKCDISESVLKESEDRISAINVDPVTQYRRKASEAARAAAEEAKKKKMENDPNSAATRDRGAAGSGNPAGRTGGMQAARKGPILPAPDDGSEPQYPELFAFCERIFTKFSQNKDTSLTARPPAREGEQRRQAPDSLPAPTDSLKSGAGQLAQLDSLKSGADSLAQLDSLRQVDSLRQIDSLANVVRDSTRVGFLLGKKKVRVFRKDMQMVCDSLAYTDLDSLIRLYRKPVIWNEIKRQYSADSISIIVRNKAIERASLMSDAFIIVQEDSLSYDQIKGAEMMAYFDSTGALRRFDAMGGASGLFYIEENDALATANRFEAKMLTATFVEGNIRDLNYFDQVKSDAFPVVQLKAEEKKLKGYDWQPHRRPKDPTDITSLQPRESQRAEYEAIPQAEFRQTDIYFPGYMLSVYDYLAQQDSLKKARKAEQRRLKKLREEESLRQADSLKLAADSLKLKSAADSLALADSLAKAAALEPVTEEASELSSGQKDDETVVQSQKDSVSSGTGFVSKEVEKARRNLEKTKEKEKRRLDREEKAALRDSAYVRKQRVKEAKWAVKDSIDAAKAKVRDAKSLERKRLRTAKTLEAVEKQNEKERKILDRYTEIFEKRKVRRNRGKAKAAAPESAPEPDIRSEIRQKQSLAEHNVNE